MRSGIAVLVVEDNERIRNAEAELLAACGYRVRTATDAQEALALLSAARIDRLVTDIRLPGCLDGIALARAAKRNWPAVKIMLVGGDVDQLSSEDTQSIADDLLTKPFKLSDLEERVGRLLRNCAATGG